MCPSDERLGKEAMKYFAENAKYKFDLNCKGLVRSRSLWERNYSTTAIRHKVLSLHFFTDFGITKMLYSPQCRLTSNLIVNKRLGDEIILWEEFNNG